jgi:hypothetical protein
MPSAPLIAIHEFASKLKGAGADAVGFLCYSGHGIASAGENYLIPVDIDEPSTVLLSVQGVKQSEVLAILRNEAPNAAHYLVLDACRKTLQGARGRKGFLPVGQQSGVLVAFAAEPGKTASDTGVGSGPYAAELVKPGTGSGGGCLSGSTHPQSILCGAVLPIIFECGPDGLSQERMSGSCVCRMGAPERLSRGDAEARL